MPSVGSAVRILSMLGAIITRLKLVIAPLLLAVVILLLAACGDSQTADTPTPEAKVAAKAIAQPTSTQEPPEPEPSADTSTPVAKVETKPSSTSEKGGSDLRVDCSLDTEQLRVSCQAVGYQPGSWLNWTSTASWAYGGGSQWQFIIDAELIAPTTQVSLEECKASICTTTTTSIDTSALVPEDTTYRTPSPAPSKTPAKEPIRVSETPSSSPDESPGNTPTEEVEFPGCKGTGTIEFDQSPMRYEDFAAIEPYGLLAGAHVTPIDHMYFTPMDRSLGRDSYEVRAIADGVLWDLGPRDVHTDTGEKKKREWRMVFAHTCTFHSYFDLLTSLAPDILAEWEETRGNRNEGWKGIPIKSGQVVGRIGGQTLDFGVYDYEIVLDGFIFPEHYDSEPWKIHTVDPFPYFPAGVREVLLQKNLRKVEPVAGKIDHDIDGKLTGNWFEVDTNWYAGKGRDRYWAGHLAIVPNHIDPTAWMFSIGHWTGEETSSGAANFIIVNAEPNPKNVGINEGIVKYELAEYCYSPVDDMDNCSKIHTPAKQLLARPNPQIDIGVVLVQMIEDRLLKVEAFPGRKITEVESFTSAAKLYER